MDGRRARRRDRGIGIMSDEIIRGVQQPRGRIVPPERVVYTAVK
jgi:hypothetical protein